jgi:acetaldehyde dehydrogenase (acetylating)
VNTPAALGAVGYTTNLFPSMTLGCGAAGGNITSDNISPLHLINLKRIAYGVRDVAASPPKAAAKAASTAIGSGGARTKIEQVVDQWLGGRGSSPAPSIPVPAASCAPPVAPPLSSFKELEPPKPKVEKKEIKPVGFVCEDDVRVAIQGNSKIVVGKKTIITPSARELAEANDVFITAE